jgi:hypothetical protein
MFAHVAAILRALVTSPRFNTAYLSGVIALPRFFEHLVDETMRWKPNTYAALREIDRLMDGSPAVPHRLVEEGRHSLQVDRALFDLCYLVDVQDYAGQTLLSGADQGVLPAIADLIVAHADRNLGPRLNEFSINVPADFQHRNAPAPARVGDASHYHYRKPRLYSTMNTHTVIFPKKDVTKALSLRLLLEVLDTHLLQRRQARLVVPNTPVPVQETLDFLGKESPSPQEKEQVGLDRVEMGGFIQGVLEWSRTGRSLLPERFLGWLMEDPEQRRKVSEVFERSRRDIPDTVEDRRDPRAHIRQVERWLLRYPGSLVDDQDPWGERHGGEWEQVLEGIVPQARGAMARRVGQLVLALLNQRSLERQESGTEASVLQANRLSYTLALLRTFREQVGQVREALRSAQERYQRQQASLRRELNEQHEELIRWTGRLPWLPWVRNPGKVYLRTFRELAEVEQQVVLYRLALDMVHQLGGHPASRERGVLDEVIGELETWVDRLKEIREHLVEKQDHLNRWCESKYALQSRSYVTDSSRFRQSGHIEDTLHWRYRASVWLKLFGVASGGSGEGGFTWVSCSDRLPGVACTISSGEEVGETDASAMAVIWQERVEHLIAEQLEDDAYGQVAGHLQRCYPDQVSLIRDFFDPHSRGLVQLTILPDQQQEHFFLAIDPSSKDQQVRDFFAWFGNYWQGDQPNRTFVEAESRVACTFLSFYHGLELDHVGGFVECEQSYRDLHVRGRDHLHLFHEEQLALEYETLLRTSSDPEEAKVGRLHPEVVACLNGEERVRSFALALVSGLVELRQTDEGADLFLVLPSSEPRRLTSSSTIDRYQVMREHDRRAARLLQAFQTFMLRGHAFGVADGEHLKIDYQAVDSALEGWQTAQDGEVTEEQAASLLQAWDPRCEGSVLFPLVHAESGDPRFRDLGLVLRVELRRWAEQHISKETP